MARSHLLIATFPPRNNKETRRHSSIADAKRGSFLVSSASHAFDRKETCTQPNARPREGTPGRMKRRGEAERRLPPLYPHDARPYPELLDLGIDLPHRVEDVLHQETVAPIATRRGLENKRGRERHCSGCFKHRREARTRPTYASERRGSKGITPRGVRARKPCSCPISEKPNSFGGGSNERRKCWVIGGPSRTSRDSVNHDVRMSSTLHAPSG